MGILDDIKSFFSRQYLPATMNISLDENTVLTYEKVDEVVNSLNDYQKKLKRLPRSYAELVRDSNNFCKHVIPALRKYQKTMVSNTDSNNIVEYKKNLGEDLANIKSECENESISRWDEETCREAFEAQNVKIGGNTKFVGVFAEKLKEASETTSTEISSYDDAKLPEYLRINSLGKAKKIIAKLKLNITNPLDGKASRAIGSASREIRRFVGEMFVEHNVDPVEYYKFGKEQYLGRSTVHAVLNILNSYKSDLKNYPKELVAYINACSHVIDRITVMLKSYVAELEVFMRAKRTRVDEIKARQNIEDILEKLDTYLLGNKENEGRDPRIFCLEANKRFKNINFDDSNFLKYNVERKDWYKSGPNQEGSFDILKRKIKGFGNTKNIDGQEIVLKGWSLGHFLVAMTPVVKKTLDELFTLINLENNSINYEKLEIKKPKSPKNPVLGKVKNDKIKNDILEILKKADLLKKHVYDLYRKVQDLGTSTHFKEVFKNNTSNVKSKYDAIFGAGGTYAKFLGEYKEIQDVGSAYTKSSSFQIRSIGSDRDLSLCINRFSQLSAYAQVIEEQCENWIQFYSRNALAGKKEQEESEKRVLQDIKLFKKKFSKIFGEAEDLFKRAKKGYNSVMKLKGNVGNEDLLATYKKTITNKYAEIVNVEFVAPFEAGTLVVFDNNGFKENNLYNCVNYAHHFAEYEGKFDNFMIEVEHSCEPILKKLRTLVLELDTEYEKVMKLFSLKNRKGLESTSKTFNSIVADLNNAISNYKDAEKLYEQDYPKLRNYREFGDDFGQDSFVVLFEGAWENLSEKYEALGKKLGLITRNQIIFEKVRLILDDENKLKEIREISADIQGYLIKMRTYFEKIKDLVSNLEKIRKNGNTVAGYLAAIRENYKAAKQLSDDAVKLNGDRFGKAFSGNTDVIEYKGLWQDLDSEYREFCKEFGMPLEGKINKSVAENIAVDEKKMAGCEGESKYFQGRLEWMQTYSAKVKKLIDKFEDNEKIVKDVAQKVIGNLEKAQKLFEQYVALGTEVGTSEKFTGSEVVVNFNKAWQEISTQSLVLSSDEFGLIDRSKLVTEKIATVSGDDEKVEKCQKISESIEEHVKKMKELLGEIKVLCNAISFSEKERGENPFLKLVDEYKKYKSVLEPLVEECKKLAGEVGIGKILQTDLEKFIKRDADQQAAQQGWENKKERYKETIESYEKSKKELDNANKILQKQTLSENEKKQLEKLEYTPADELEEKFNDFKEWVEGNKKLYEESLRDGSKD